MAGVISSFSGEYRFLSNFWPCMVEYEGITYTSTEHAYQAAKSTNKDIRQAFADITSAAAVKKIGQTITIRPDWEKVKINVMRDIVTAKFEQNENLMDLLMATKGQELIEGNTWGDTFWGQCPLGTGKNELGKILMGIRDDITRIGMTKEEFNSLSTNDRALVIEGYIDGFAAAIEVVQSVIRRIGDPTIDKVFVTNRDSIVHILNDSLEKMKASINA